MAKTDNVNKMKKIVLMPPILLSYLMLSTISAPVYRLIERRRLALGKENFARIGERMGFAGCPRPVGTLIWFHAASVGESLSLLKVIDGLLFHNPNLYILMTTTTVTSAQILSSRLPARAIHQFCPYDTPHAVQRFLKHWRPDLAVWTESELWPRMMMETKSANISMHLINARVSDKSASVWRRWPRTVAWLLNMFDTIAVQDWGTAKLMLKIGVLSKKIAVTGSTKENIGQLNCDAAELFFLQSKIGGRPVWLAASTHEGEEKIILKAHRKVIEEGDPLTLLLLVPRHPQRASVIMSLINDESFKGAQRSLGENITQDTNVYVADTLGEMGLWYRLSPISFLGGSLSKVGGHNPFEPIALNSAIISGRHVFNFNDAYQKLWKSGGCQLIRDSDELSRCVLDLRISSNQKKSILNAKSVLQDNSNATSSVIKNLTSYVSS